MADVQYDPATGDITSPPPVTPTKPAQNLSPAAAAQRKEYLDLQTRPAAELRVLAVRQRQSSEKALADVRDFGGDLVGRYAPLDHVLTDADEFLKRGDAEPNDLDKRKLYIRAYFRVRELADQVDSEKILGSTYRVMAEDLYDATAAGARKVADAAGQAAGKAYDAAGNAYDAASRAADRVGHILDETGDQLKKTGDTMQKVLLFVGGGLGIGLAIALIVYANNRSKSRR